MSAKPPPQFRPFAARILAERYLYRDPEGRVVETTDALRRRVCRIRSPRFPVGQVRIMSASAY